MRQLLPFIAVAGVSLCMSALAQTPPASANATLIDAAGQVAGTAQFTPAAQGVQIDLQVNSGLAAGEHGWHIHTHGECGPGPDAVEKRIVPFGAAGPHFDPMMTHNHGRPDEGPRQAHAGDLPNIVAGAQGGSMRFVAPRLSLEPGRQSIVGRSIVIHQNGDDYITDPAGNSGPRVLCGVIEPQTPGAALFAARWLLPGPNAYPEGIAIDEAAGYAYTGSASEGHLYRWNIKEPGTPLQPAKAEMLAFGGSPGRQHAIGMKLDERGRLWVAAGDTGMLAVVDSRSGMTLAVLKTPSTAQTFINDLALVADGYTYVTDSIRPVLWRVRRDGDKPGTMEPWLALDATPIRYVPGINLNGIVATPDGRTLIAVQSVTGLLWRIDTRTKAVKQIAIDSPPLTGGDGLVLDGRMLYVVRNEANEIVRIDLNPGFSQGRVAFRGADPRLKYPTTAARLADGSLFVINGQLNKQKEPPPLLPFDAVTVRTTMPR